MAVLRERLQEMLEPVVEALGYELVLLEYAPSHNALLRLYIDQPAGIRVEDCERVSREVSALMDVEDPISGNYRLEVSSPGMDRPLTKPAHFTRFLGEEVKAQMLVPVGNRRKFAGKLVAADEQGFTLETPDGLQALDYAGLERARLVLPFDSKPEPY